MLKKELPTRWALIMDWKKAQKTNTSLRFGEYFVTEYCGTWPKLFNAKDSEALEIIREFYRETQRE